MNSQDAQTDTLVINTPDVYNAHQEPQEVVFGNSSYSSSKIFLIVTTAILVLIMIMGMAQHNNDALAEPASTETAQETTQAPVEPVTPLWDTATPRTLQDAAQQDIGTIPTMNIVSAPNTENYLPVGNLDKCSSAGMAEQDGQWYVLTAGHCVKNGEKITLGDATLTPSSFKDTEDGNDFGWFKVEGDFYPGMIPTLNGSDEYVHTNTTASPQQGQKVCSFGNTSGWMCGEITQVNNGEISTNFCSKLGDSGSGIYNAQGALVGVVTAIAKNNQDAQPCQGTHSFITPHNEVGTYGTSIDKISLNNHLVDNMNQN